MRGVRGPIRPQDRRLRKRVGLVFWVVLAACIVGLISLSRRPRVDPTLARVVEADAGISKLAADERGTEVTGFIDNKGTVPVDVTVRFRAFDVLNPVITEVEPRPLRGIGPGATKPVPVKISSTPVERWEMEIIELAPFAEMS